MALIIAHRGYSGKYPENTLLSIEKAIEAGFHGVELDVRATADGKLVLFHDPSLYRIFGIKSKISAKKYDDIRLLAPGLKENIPLLSDALKIMKDSSLLIINLEINVPAYEEEILELINEHGLVNRILLSSKTASILQRLRMLDEEVKLAYIIDNRPDKMRKWRKLHKEVELFAVHHFCNRAISNTLFYRSLRRYGIKAAPWFLLKSRKQIVQGRNFIRLGAYAVFTDYPDLLHDKPAEEQTKHSIYKRAIRASKALRGLISMRR
jgi:glycerophosphoryl diester phosphodiesterase